MRSCKCFSVNTVWIDFDPLIFTRQREYQSDSKFCTNVEAISGSGRGA